MYGFIQMAHLWGKTVVKPDIIRKIWIENSEKKEFSGFMLVLPVS